MNSRAITLSDKEKVITVDSGNLHLYLAGILSSQGRPIHFAPHLDLAYYSPFLRELWDKSILGYRFNEEERKHKIPVAKESDSQAVKDIITKTGEGIRAYFNQMAPTERNLQIYYDWESKSLKATPIIYGDHTSVRRDPFEQAYLGNTILWDIHTHPQNALPSPVDYDPLLYDLYLPSGRGMYGIIVLCPDIQIMALASPLTPLLTEEQLGKRQLYWNEILEEKNKQIEKSYFPQINRLYERNKTEINRLIKSQVRRIKILSQSFIEEEIAIDDMRMGMEIYKRKRRRARANLWKKSRRIVKSVNDESEYFLNSLNLESARDINVKLYYATDFQDFREFTA